MHHIQYRYTSLLSLDAGAPCVRYFGSRRSRCARRKFRKCTGSRSVKRRFPGCPATSLADASPASSQLFQLPAASRARDRSPSCQQTNRPHGGLISAPCGRINAGLTYTRHRPERFQLPHKKTARSSRNRLD